MRKLSLFLSFSLSAVLTAQVARNQDIPLKNWPAPMYWQPSAAEIEAAGEKAPSILRSQAASAAPPLVFIAMTPCRVVDTRASQMFPSPFGAPGLTPGPARSFPIQSSTLCPIPATAQAYSFNVTLVPPGPVGYLTIWPMGTAQPNAVTVDDITGDIRNNAAIVPAGTPNGSVSAVVNANTDLVIDVNGYYVPLNQTGIGSGNTAIGLGALLSNTTGYANTASGDSALYSNTTGRKNTASGTGSLQGNTTGFENTASGAFALYLNTSGIDNTATGASALLNNITGNFNTADGALALTNNTTGIENTASGAAALFSNTIGSDNTASGNSALSNNSSGSANTASGVQSLLSNSTGNSNTASGVAALKNNTTGTANTASGAQSLYSNTTGSYNTASGYNALSSNTSGGNNTAFGGQALSNTTGGSNTALGFNAGINITTGSNNVHIVNPGTSSDNAVIRVGTSPNHTAFFAAGIRGVTTANNDAMPVMIDSAGELGTTSSSRRFKEDIQDMADASSGLLRLRPVTFRYQQPYADGSKPIDYGLIAEEVASIYPDLVVKGADGKVETVQYHKLAPMLLNELQRLQTRVSVLETLLEEVIRASH